MTIPYPLSLVWLRRDLRLDDNMALSEACKQSKRVAVAFIFDSEIQKKLKSMEDHRVFFIYESLREIDIELRKKGSQLIVLHGNPTIEIPKLVSNLNAGALFYNEEYEPYTKKRDKKVCTNLKKLGFDTFAFKDQVIFSGEEVKKSDGKPYQVFTPYKRVWLKKLKAKDFSLKKVGTNYLEKNYLAPFAKNWLLKKKGFEITEVKCNFHKPGRKSGRQSLKFFAKNLVNYQEDRDFPFLKNGTSGLSVHLRFGTVSIRECVTLALKTNSKGAQAWLTELIWREFYQMILDQFPYVAKECFKKQYNKIKWINNRNHFMAWCEGRTGFPIIDAGMRQLNETGWMHNRVRMITASFLVKDLLIDWRKGERYFAEKLLDFDLAANNGGWQWCASTGCDAQPYFRIFNPSLQSKKYDPDAEYIKSWVPELENCSAKSIHNPEESELFRSFNYPKPIVDHSIQKKLALQMFQKVRSL